MGKFGRIARSRLAMLAFATLAGVGGTAFSAETVPVITTVAGGGTSSGNGDGGPATQARLTNPVDVAFDAGGNLYIADIAVYSGEDGFKVRKVDAAGVIRTVAGNGTTAYNGDGIPATSAGISVQGIAVDRSGNLYIADAHNQRVRKVSPGGIISTVAGTGVAGFSGDGGPATNARLNFPSDVATDADGNLLIVDRFNYRIRRVGADGVIRTVAGNGEYGFSGDGGAATAASLAEPHGVAVSANGDIFVADYGNDRVRRVSPTGNIFTFAGGGPFRSDPVARNMRILHPHGVAVDGRGNVYIAEMNNLVRVVNRAGIIAVAAGPFNDTTWGNEGAPSGYGGDGGPATEALLYEPRNLALDAQENVYIADSRNGRVRKVTRVPTPATPAGLDAFHPYQIHMVGSFTQHVAIADVTGDGRDDALLTTTTWSGDYAEPANDFKLLLFAQRSDGSLAAPKRYSYYGDTVGGRSGTGLATGDFNRDGIVDVVIGTLKGITIYFGSPSGLTGKASYSGVTGAEAVLSVALMDVNLDRKPDIVTFSSGRSEGGTSPEDRSGIIVFYGNGAGAVSSKRFIPRPDEYGWQFLRAGDVDRDGILDLTSTWTHSGSGVPAGGVEFALPNGSGGFRPTVRLQAALADYWGAAYALGDFDGDGRQDFVVSRDGNAPDARYALFRQSSTGQFAETRSWPAYDGPADMVAADMNGDGRKDLLVLHAGWSSIGLHQQGRHGLDVEVKYLSVHSSNPRIPALAVGDLNGDGCKDAAASDYNYGLIVHYGKNCLRTMPGAQPWLPPARGQGAAAAPRAAVASSAPDRRLSSDRAAVRETRGAGERDDFEIDLHWFFRLIDGWSGLFAPAERTDARVSRKVWIEFLLRPIPVAAYLDWVLTGFGSFVEPE